MIKLTNVSYLLLLALIGCKDNEQVINACHDAVHSEAKYTAEIVSTEVLNRNSVDTVVFGKAKFQNGYGAWNNKVYRCDFVNENRTKFELLDGWGSYPPHKFK